MNNRSENPFSSSEITSEKNLFQVFRKSLKLPRSTFNILATTSFVLVMVLYVSFSERAIELTIKDVYELSTLGFNLSASILGFLIAGLAIFVAISDLSIFVNMAKVAHSSGLSYLKYNFITLMYVFIIFINLALFCFLIQVLGKSYGVISLILVFLKKLFGCLDINFLKNVSVKITLVLVSGWIFYAILLLKTFIFNIYHLSMAIIRWEVDRIEEDS